MLDTNGKLQSIEGVLKDICLKLGITEAAHIDGSDDERRRKLLKLALGALRELDGDNAAMSLEQQSSRLTAEDRASNILAHAMGVKVPRELR